MEQEANDLPEELYHYTSPTALLGILEKGSAWATMIHYMNDAQEMQYAFDLARTILVEESGSEIGTLNTLTPFEELFNVMKYVAVFAFSLSSRKDLLSQWRAYCPPEGGYCITFDSGMLRSFTEEQGFYFVRCIYNYENQKSVLRPLLRELLAKAAELPAEGSGMDLYREFGPRIVSICTSLKHPAFEEEQEWRLISGLGPEWDLVRFRATNSLIVPYREIVVRRESNSAIRSVMVGPNRHPELAARSLHQLSVQMHQWPIRVEHSQAPFRVLR